MTSVQREVATRHTRKLSVTGSLWQRLWPRRRRARGRSALRLEELEPRELLAGSPPSLFLTPSLLANLRQQATVNTPAWNAFQARLTQNLNVVTSGYEASGLQFIADYALGYQVLQTINPTLANQYADKAIGIMQTALHDNLSNQQSPEQFLAIGDGKTTTFTLPDPDPIPGSIGAFLVPIQVVPVTRGPAFTSDVVGFNFHLLSVSDTNGGPANYTQGVDWQVNSTLSIGSIDWSLGIKEPTPGSTYFVTEANPFDPNSVRAQIKVNGNVITLTQTPAPGQAVFVQYVTSGNHHQTGNGDGGFNNILISTAYTGRYLGKFMSIGLDWLDTYAGFTPAFRTQVVNMLEAWFNFLETSSQAFQRNNPASNYGTGDYGSNVITAVALLNRDPVNGPSIMAQALADRQTNLLPLLQSQTNAGFGPFYGTNLAGGFWDEGWSYGWPAAQSLLEAGLALEGAGQITAANFQANEGQWANQVIVSLLEAQPSQNTVYNGGDWYQYPASFLDKDLFYILSGSATDPNAISYSNYVLQNYSTKDRHDFVDLVFGNASIPATFWGTTLPLENFAVGTGLLTARSDWGTSPTWVSLQFENLQASHQVYTAGQLQIQRGADDLLLNATALDQTQSPQVESAHGNTVIVDDNGEGLQTNRFAMDATYGSPGLVVNAFEANVNYDYMSGDFHAAYSTPTKPGGIGSASELNREMVYVRPGIILVYDRVTTVKNYYPKQVLWHFKVAPTVSGNGFVETVGSSSLYGQMMSEVPLTTTLAAVTVKQATFQELTTQNTQPTASVRFVTAFQVAASTAAAPPPPAHIASNDNSLEGAEVQDQVVLFGRNGTASPTAGLSYQFTGSALNPIQHLIVDLQPGQQFQVALNGQLLTTLTSSAQGTISFATTGKGTETVQLTQITGNVGGPQVATHFVITGLSSTLTGVLTSFNVTALDARNNVVTGYTGAVQLSTTATGASLPGTYTFTTTDGGTHAFVRPNGLIFPASGTFVVTATDKNSPTVTGQATVAVTSNAVTQFSISGPTSVTAGAPATYTITALDANNNIVTTYRGTVHFSSTAAGATLPSNYTFVGADAGVHRYTSGVTFPATGAFVVTVTDTASSSISGQVTVTANSAAITHFVVSGPSSVAVGALATFTITAEDASNNVVTGYTGTIHFTSTPAGANLPANYTFTATDKGVHIFTSAVSFPSTGSWTVSVTDTSTASVAGQATVTVTALPGATHFTISGPASVTAGASATLTVTALDASNNVVPGYTGTIHFTSTAPGANLPPNYTFTATDNGVHTFSNASSFPTAGSWVITATDTATSSLSGQTNVTVTPGAVNHLVVTGPTTWTAGSPASYTVTAEDSHNNVVTGYTGTIHFTTTAPGATLPGNYTFTTTDAGVHVFANVFTLPKVGSWTVTATDTANSAISGQITVTVVPGAVSKFVVSGPSSVTTGTAATFTITAQDANNNVVTGYTGTVHFTSTPTGATLPGNYTFTTTDAGVHAFTNAVTLKTAGSSVVTVTDTVNAAVSGQATVTVTSAVATHVVVSGPSSVAAGSPATYTVSVQDASNNVVTSYTGTIHFTTTAPGATLPSNYTFTATDAGVHAFTNGVTMTKTGSWVITATDTANSNVTGQAAVTVTPGAVKSLVVSGPTSVTAGSPATYTVTAQDANNNVVTGYTGTIHFTASAPPGFTLPPNFTFALSDKGTHTFTNAVILPTTGTWTVTATDTTTAPLTGQVNVTVTPGAVSQLVLSGPTSATTGSAVTFTVTAEDATNNVVPSYTGTIHFTSTPSGATLPGNYTFTSSDKGVHTFTGGVSFPTSGTWVVTATDTAKSSITGQASVTVTASLPAHLVITGPSSVTAGSQSTYTVTAEDASNNVVTSYTGTVHFSTTAPGATLPSNFTFTAGANGTHTFTNGVVLPTAGSWVISVTDTTNSSVSGQFNVTVTPGAVSQLILSGPTSVTAGAPTSYTVTAEDANNNIVTGYTGTIHFGSVPNGATLPGNYTFSAADQGVHTFTNAVTLPTTGTWILSATDTTTASVTGQISVSVVPGAVSQLVVTGPTTVTAGAPTTYTVTAEDANNNIVTGYTGTVQFASTPNGAALPGPFTFTAADQGVHTFTSGVTFPAAGGWTLTATDSGNVVSGHINVTATNAAPTHFLLTGPASVTAGAAATYTVTVEDASNNLVPGYTGTIQFTTTAPGATLPANYTFTAADGGSHVFTNGVILPSAGTWVVTATDTVTSGLSGQANVTVTPGALDHFAVSGPTNLTAGKASTYTVTAQDVNNNVVTGFTGTIQFSTTAPSSSLPANYTFTSADKGLHTFTSGIKLNTAGSWVVTATDTSNGAVAGQVNVTVAPGSVSQFVVSGPTTVTVGSAATFTVTAQDANSNVVTNYAGTIHFTSTPAGAALPANYTFTTTDQGVHAFTNAVSFPSTGSWVVAATDTSKSSLTGSAKVTVTAQPAATHFTVSGPASVTAGAPATFTVTALDASNNIVPGYTGTIHFTSTAPGATLPANYTFNAGDAGAHTFTNGLSFPTTGSWVVTATDTAKSTLSGQTNITVTPGAVSSLVLTGPTNVSAGAASTYMVTAVDANDNVVTGYTGTIQFGSVPPGATLPSNYTFTAADQGVHTFTSGVTLPAAGTTVLSATDTTNTSVTGQITVAVAPGAVSQFVISIPSGVTTGAPTTFTVTAEDAKNNIVPGYTGTVQFASTPSGATLPGNYTFTASDQGVHTFTNGANFPAAGGWTVTATDTVNAGVTGQASLTATNAVATHFQVQIVGTGSVKAGTATPVKVTVLDANNNPVPAYTGTIQFTTNAPVATLPSNYTFTTGPGGDNGSHTFSVTINTAGNAWLLTATDTSSSTLLGQTNVTVTPAAATAFSVTASSSLVKPGAADKLTILAVDPFGNVDPTYRGTVRFTSNDPKATLPARQTFAAANKGILTVSVVLRTVGNRTVSVTDVAHTKISGSVGIKVSTAPPPGPVVTLSGPKTGLPGQIITFTLSAAESGLPSSTVWNFNIDWDGNGVVDQIITGPSGTTVDHIFQSSGKDNILITATDPNNLTGPATPSTISLPPVALAPDPLNPGKTALFVVGTTGTDFIILDAGAAAGSVNVGLNNKFVGTFQPTGQIYIFGGGGNDVIQLLPNTINNQSLFLQIPAMIFSGPVTDLDLIAGVTDASTLTSTPSSAATAGNVSVTLVGSKASNVVVGGIGNDTLIGGPGRDVLIGGTGSDKLIGGSGGQLLIGGSTDYDNDLQSLAAIMAEWASSLSYSQRISDLLGTTSGGLNGSAVLQSGVSVHPDQGSNSLTGGSGLDWFWLQASPLPPDTLVNFNPKTEIKTLE
jgi:hypothetical protein